MLRAAGGWLGRTMVKQSVYHADSFLLGFLASVLFLCCIFGPNGIIRNTMEVAPNWILIIAITLSYSYIDRLVRRSQRERRQRQIDETQDSGSVLGGGGPTLD